MAHASRGGSKGRKTSFEAFSTHSSLGAPRRKRKSAKKYALKHGHFTAASQKKEESEKTATFIAPVSALPRPIDRVTFRAVGAASRTRQAPLTLSEKWPRLPQTAGGKEPKCQVAAPQKNAAQ